MKTLEIRLFAALTFILMLAACASTPTSSSPSTAAPSSQSSVNLSEARVVSPEYFLNYINEMRVAVENGKPRQLDAKEIQRVNRIVGELRETLTGIESIQDLSSNDKNQVFNATQELWATIHEAQHQQVVCEEAVRTGSRIRSTDCRTARQLSNDRDQYREFMRSSIYAPQTPPAGIP